MTITWKQWLHPTKDAQFVNWRHNDSAHTSMSAASLGVIIMFNLLGHTGIKYAPTLST